MSAHPFAHDLAEAGQPPGVVDSLPGTGLKTGKARTSNQDEAKFTTVVNTLPQAIEFILRVLGPTTLVVIQPNSRKIVARWIEDVTDHVTRWVEDHNRAQRNIYLSANRPQQNLNKKANKSEIVAYRCLYADVDAKSGRSMEECLTSIEQLPLPPSFVIMTGGGYQPIWLLDRPLPASPENIHWAEAAGRTIAELTKGDQVENVDRILRLPGTTNHPNATKRTAGRTPCMSSIMVRQ